MIKFFRKIRRNLLMENKTGKYFKYAIGEIVLVVIGILIALSINNWNTKNIDSQKEKEYLSNLIEDIETQRIIVGKQIKHESDMRSSSEKAIHLLNSDNIDTDSLNSYLTTITRKTFVINDPTFQDLKTSGNILLIRNNELRNKIISFYQNLEYSALVIEVSNETNISKFREYIVQNSLVDMNYRDSLTVAGGVDFTLKTTKAPWAKKIQEDKLNDKEYLLIALNRISQRGRTSSVHLDLMQRLEQRIENMKTDIEKHLK